MLVYVMRSRLKSLHMKEKLSMFLLPRYQNSCLVMGFGSSLQADHSPEPYLDKFRKCDNKRSRERGTENEEDKLGLAEASLVAVAGALQSTRTSSPD